MAVFERKQKGVFNKKIDRIIVKMSDGGEVTVATNNNEDTKLQIDSALQK